MRTKFFDRNGSNHGRLEEKVAIVTGAGTGIGEAIEDVAKAIRDNKGEAVAFAGDISEERAAKQCIDLAINEFKRLDVLVNNAGVFLDNAMTQDYPIADFDETIRMNIRSAFLMTRFALP